MLSDVDLRDTEVAEGRRISHNNKFNDFHVSDVIRATK